MPDYIPDYNDLHSAYEDKQEEELKKHPKCDHCGEPITDDTFFIIGNEYICEECLNNEYRVSTENYIED